MIDLKSLDPDLLELVQGEIPGVNVAAAEVEALQARLEEIQVRLTQAQQKHAKSTRRVLLLLKAGGVQAAEVGAASRLGIHEGTSLLVDEDPPAPPPPPKPEPEPVVEEPVVEEIP